MLVTWLKVGDVRITRILKDPHLIDPTSPVGCLAVLLKTLLNMCKQFCEDNG